MPQCIGEELTEEGWRRCEQPSANGHNEYCFDHGLDHEQGSSPGSGDSISEGLPGIAAGGDERQAAAGGTGRRGEIARAVHSRHQGYTRGEGPDDVRTNGLLVPDPIRLARFAKSKDIRTASDLGYQRLASLKEDEKNEDIGEMEGEINPSPRAGATTPEKGRPCLPGPDGSRQRTDGGGGADEKDGDIRGGVLAGNYVGVSDGNSGGSHGVDGGGSGGVGGGGGGGDARQIAGDEREGRNERDWRSIKRLMFDDNAEHQIQDTANWNELFQAALDLPEQSTDQCYVKWQRLTTVNRDFVAAAVTYGKTIISEYFLDNRDKSIKPVEVGGACGGIKFVWRGILFKLADGSKGPYCGNDEAAAKGAGHDLRGATHYLGTRIPELHYALQCLIDYKGFRMTAQAELPVNPGTLQYGTADGGRTVLNEDASLAEKLKEAGTKLNLRTHEVKGKEMHSACDIEGHKSDKDNRYYLLDFSRSFPPESPYKVEHLSRILSDGTPVHVHDHDVTNPKHRDRRVGGKPRQGVISETSVDHRVKVLEKRHITYTVRLDDGPEIIVPATRVTDRHLSIYWRMLRPEFVKGDADTMAYRQCPEPPGTPPPRKAPALRKNHMSRVSETGEDGSDISTVEPAAPASSFKGLARASSLPSLAEEEEKRQDWGEADGYEVAMSGERLGDQGGSASRGGGVSGDSDRSGDPAAACSTPSRRRLFTSGGRSTPSRRFLVHDGVGSYEVFMDYDPVSQTEVGAEVGGRGSSRGRGGSQWQQSTSNRRMRMIARGGSSFLFSSSRDRDRVNHGNNSAPMPRPGSYEAQEPSGRQLLRKVGSMSFFGGGSDGAVGRGSRRAAPRGVMLEGDGTSSNVSYRFYDADRRQQPGSMANLVQDIAAAAKWQFIPLSPDALSGFTKDAKDRSDINQDVHEATAVMVDVAVVKVAERLMELPPEVQGTLDLAVELHRHGVNVRHLGKVRDLVPDEEENSVLRDMMLTEIIARTLKNILRRFQRKWMEAEKSTSEQGMRILVVGFLNLVTGCHRNSGEFWEEKVLVGVLQRFGVIALTKTERKDILKTCIYDRPHVLEICVARLTEMQGLVLTPEAEEQFSSEEESPFQFQFVVSDIQEIRPIVRYMHILDYGGGVMLSMQAEKLKRAGNASPRTIERLKCMARQYFIKAYQSKADDENTRSALLSYLGEISPPPPTPPEPEPKSKPKLGGCLRRALGCFGWCCSSARRRVSLPPGPQEDPCPRRQISHGGLSVNGSNDGPPTGLSEAHATADASEDSDVNAELATRPPSHPPEYEHFYEPAEDTYLLIDALHADAEVLRNRVRPSLCLEIGPGSGLVTAALCALLQEGGRKEEEEAPAPVALQRKLLRPLFMAAEINPRAAAACVRTAKANKVEPFEVVCCDLASCVGDRLRQQVDILVFNPPYVPTPPEEVGSKDIAAAWAGGERGREVVDRFLPAVKELLSPTGCFYMVTVEDNDPAEIISIMRGYGVHGEVVLRRRAKNEALSILRMRHD
eukprot:g14039.t1